MANDKINVNMFGTFSLSRGNVTVDLTKLLGKQLINLFQLLLLQKGVVISKNNIIDILYPDSENPNSVVKFSIFRLRKDLKVSGIFNEDEEVILTVKGGYQINPKLEWVMDTEEFYYNWDKIKYIDDISDKDLAYAQKVNHLYKGKLYITTNHSIWIEQMLEFFRSAYVNCVIKICKYYMKRKQFEKMMSINYHAILLEPFYEGLHYYYIKGLIELKDYHNALKYYDDLNERFYKELGTGLSPRFKELYDVITEDIEEDYIINTENVNEDLIINNADYRGFYCGYDMFKHMYEILLKNALRDNKKYFLIIFDLNAKTTIENQVHVMNQLKEMIASSLRVNDLFAKINKKQYIILVACQEMDNAYTIIQRINKKFYAKYNSTTYRLNYDVAKAKLLYKKPIESSVQS